MNKIRQNMYTQTTLNNYLDEIHQSPKFKGKKLSSIVVDGDIGVETLDRFNLVQSYYRSLPHNVTAPKSFWKKLFGDCKETPKKFELPKSKLVLHWSGGTRKVSKTDHKHYHHIVGENDTLDVTKEKAQADETSQSYRKNAGFKSHVKNFNTGTLGICIAGMFGTSYSNQGVFRTSEYVFDNQQLERFIKDVAKYSLYLNIPVHEKTICTHAEVGTIHRVPQNGKWDIRWFPSVERIWEAKEAGDHLRSLIIQEKQNVENFQ